MQVIRLAAFGCDEEERELLRRKAPESGIEAVCTEHNLSAASVAFARGCSCVSVNHKSAVDASLLQTLKKQGVGYICTRSIGCNHIDIAAARRLSLEVGNVSYSPASVADFTLMLILMQLRHMKSRLAHTAAQDFRLPAARGGELKEATVGVAGTGRIGRAVIERLRGFGCRIIAYDRQESPGIDYVSAEALLREADIISLHLPLETGTRHFINAGNIGLLKPGAILINTGRGGLIETPALVKALADGRLGGAALDVLEDEENIFYKDLRGKPLPNACLAQLMAMDNVLVTPHTAFYTRRAAADMIENTLLNCLEYERRKELCAVLP